MFVLAARITIITHTTNETSRKFPWTTRRNTVFSVEESTDDKQTRRVVLKMRNAVTEGGLRARLFLLVAFFSAAANKAMDLARRHARGVTRRITAIGAKSGMPRGS